MTVATEQIHWHLPPATECVVSTSVDSDVVSAWRLREIEVAQVLLTKKRDPDAEAELHT